MNHYICLSVVTSHHRYNDECKNFKRDRYRSDDHKRGYGGGGGGGYGGGPPEKRQKSGGGGGGASALDFIKQEYDEQQQQHGGDQYGQVRTQPRMRMTGRQPCFGALD